MNEQTQATATAVVGQQQPPEPIVLPKGSRAAACKQIVNSLGPDCSRAQVDDAMRALGLEPLDPSSIRKIKRELFGLKSERNDSTKPRSKRRRLNQPGPSLDYIRNHIYGLFDKHGDMLTFTEAIDISLDEDGPKYSSSQFYHCKRQHKAGRVSAMTPEPEPRATTTVSPVVQAVLLARQFVELLGDKEEAKKLLDALSVRGGVK